LRAGYGAILALLKQYPTSTILRAITALHMLHPAVECVNLRSFFWVELDSNEPATQHVTFTMAAIASPLAVLVFATCVHLVVVRALRPCEFGPRG